ncbi:MAG TPA: ABC transporter permease subunit [Candidatus Eisenbergiella stercoravium]|nr:ABC transporter permease subunit [Candidatus Eisenbergiella stercoravium]
MKKKNLKHLKKNLYRCRLLYLMILPSLITVFIFHYIPIYGVQIAFKDYRSSLGILGSKWVGLKYFIEFINYPYFEKVMVNTIRISLVCLCTFPIPIIFSIMLNELRSSKVKKVSQMITYAPHFVSTVVVCSMLMLFLDKDGLINNIIAFFGGERVSYLSVPSAFAPIYAISDLWQGLGWGTIIYLATLAGISVELVEAAKIDGAGRLQTIWHVHLPYLKPTIITLFILKMGSLISVGFEKVFLLQNPLNLDASSVISTYVYEVGIINHQYSYSSAIGLFNNIINIILLMIANTVSKKVAETSLW